MSELSYAVDLFRACKNQREAAMLYADHISGRGALAGFPPVTVNLAVSARWPKGLSRVKVMAWRLVEGGAK